MPTAKNLGKFAPLAMIAAVQLLIVLLVPSVGANGSSTLSSGGTGTGTGTYSNGQGATTGGSGTARASTGTGGSLTGHSSGSTGGTVTGAGGVSSGGSGSVNAPGGNGPNTAVGPSPAGVTGGDTTHCVDGRQFSPAIDFYAPPCVAGTVGAPDPNNGGATSFGVTSNQIEIVHYVPNYGAEVNAILQAQGLYYDASTAQTTNIAFQNFINSHYQLYGRKIHVDTYQGQCATVPPDLPCLIPEMDRIVAQYKPYAVFFTTTVCSACFQELARLHVVSTGGAGFSDAFHNANAPYSYDAEESSSRVEEQFAQFWCNQMTSQGGSGRTAIFAGTENPTQNFTHQPRVLGVVAPNDPDNETTIKDVLYPALKAGCGENVSHQYFYAQNINTATQQSQAGEQAMNTASNPATSVICLCDPVAPQFSYNASSNNNYWPEALFASDQTMDWDSTAQTYAQAGQGPTLACPKPQIGCGFDGAVGLGSSDAQTAPSAMAGVKIYHLETGGTSALGPPVLQVFWDNYNLLASLIENTGPDLTPARMQAAAPSMGSRGGGNSGHALRAFTPGDWCWIQDVRVVYWNKYLTSPYNGQHGSYVPIEGSRFNLGQFPTLSEPPAPPAAARH